MTGTLCAKGRVGVWLDIVSVLIWVGNLGGLAQLKQKQCGRIAGA